jgi:hypothetical protein
MDAKPGSVEGWNAWGPTINGVHQTWLGSPVSLDVTQVYADMQAAGLCLIGGDHVPFVAVQAQAEEKPEIPEPLRVLAEGAPSNVEQSSLPVNPNLARLAPVETQASVGQLEPTPAPPVQTVGGGGLGTVLLIGLAGAGAWVYQQWENRVDIPVAPDHELADMSLASTPVRPAVSAGIHAGTLVQQGVSPTNQLANQVTNHREPPHEPIFSGSRTVANQLANQIEPLRTNFFNVANQVSPFPEPSRTKNLVATTDRTREAAMRLVRQHLADMYEISETVDAVEVSPTNQISPSPEPTPNQVGSLENLREKYFTLRNGGIHNKKKLALILFDAKSGNNQSWMEASQQLDEWKTEWEKLNV